MEEEDEQGMTPMRWWGNLLWALVVGLVTPWMLTGYPAAHFENSHVLRQFCPSLACLPDLIGYTAEILNIVEKMNFEHYFPRCYIAAVTDNHSLAKAKRLEEEKNDWRFRPGTMQNVVATIEFTGAEKSVNPT